MPFIPRIGRPGLLGLAARTAVVAGTATAVSSGIIAHQQKHARTQYEAAQYETAQYQTTQDEAAPATATIPATPAAGPGAGPGDLVAELQRLGDLRTQGLLSDTEFETAKAGLLR